MVLWRMWCSCIRLEQRTHDGARRPGKRDNIVAGLLCAVTTSLIRAPHTCAVLVCCAMAPHQQRPLVRCLLRYVCAKKKMNALTRSLRSAIENGSFFSIFLASMLCHQGITSCSQLCTTIGGEEVCSCRNGYTLDEDEATCLGESKLTSTGTCSCDSW